jgi:hypothetical protein
MKMLDSEYSVENTKRAMVAPRESFAPMLANRSLAPVRASSIAPGLRELRLWELPQGAVGRCELEVGDRVALTGMEGQCWVTQQGDRHDYLLVPGKTLSFRGPGMLVFEAVGDSATLAVS